MQPNYSDYTLAELREAYEGIDREKHPENFRKLCDEVDRRGEMAQIIKASKSWITGFFRRVFAYFIDSCLIAFVLLCLTFVLKDFFVQVGSETAFIGFSIALAYFSVMNSKVMNGQTLGKKLFKIQVVDAHNQTITLTRSFFRSGLLFLLLFSGNLFVSQGIETVFEVVFFTICSAFGVFSIFYLYVFNKRTRQSLHDLVIGTYVVNKGVEKEGVASLWRGHFIVLGLYLVGAVLFYTQSTQLALLKNTLDVSHEIIKEPSVFSANLLSVKKKIKTESGRRETTVVQVKVILSSNDVTDKELAQRLAKVVASQYQAAEQADIIRITLMHGFNLGVFSNWSKHSYDFNPHGLKI